MPPLDAFSHDQAVKNLIKDYPIEALEFLAPDVLSSRGTPVSVSFLDPAVAKDDANEPGPGQAMDLAIRFEFSDGPGVILVLVEHWSSAAKLDLLRTARYYLDLCRRFPVHEILSIALVDDDRPHDLLNTVERGALDEVHFRFCTRIVQIPSLRLERFRDTANRVALSFSPNMAGVQDPVEQVLHVALVFRELGDMAGFRKFFAFWVVEGRLHEKDQSRLHGKLKELDMPIIMEWFRQEGIELGKQEGLELGKKEGLELGKQEGLELGKKEGRQEGRQEGAHQKALEDARRMDGHGISWDIITDVTGIRREDLEV